MQPQASDLNQDDDGRIELAPGVRVPRGALDWSFTTSRGPGGQNVNKRETRAVLRISIDELGLNEGARLRLFRNASHWLVDDARCLQIACEEHRSQTRNKQGCLAQLRAMLVAIAKPPRPRKKTKPTRGSVERRLKEKRVRSDVKSRRSRQEGSE